MRRLLVDTGSLVALRDARDPDYERCRTVVTSRTGQLCTTRPVVTKSRYLLSHSLLSQQRLLGLIQAGKLEIVDIVDLVERVASLLARYANVPMDFTDATLIAVAERERLAEIFTLDSDFQIYRVGRRALRVVP